MLAVFDRDLPAAVQHRHPAGFDDQFVIRAIGGSSHDASRVDVPNEVLALGEGRRVAHALGLGFYSNAVADDVFDGPVPVTSGNQSAAAQVEVLQIIGAGLGKLGRAG